MLCKKCGSKVDKGSKFCPKCGADMAGAGQAKSPGEPGKKKSKNWIPAVVNIIAVLVIVIAFFWEDRIDYVATVKVQKPFAVSQGLHYTYEEVFDRYIISPKWKTRKSGDEAYVDISGKLRGTDMRVLVIVSVIPDPQDPHGVLIRPSSVALDGEEASTQEETVQFLYRMFAAYDEGYMNLAHLLSEGTAGFWLGGQADSGDRKVYYMGDTIHMFWDDGKRVDVDFLEWGIYRNYANDKILYIECEITNTGEKEIAVTNWFDVYADNYAVYSYIQNMMTNLSKGRSVRGRILAEVDPDTVSVIEVEFADAVLIVKDEF